MRNYAARERQSVVSGRQWSLSQFVLGLSGLILIIIGGIVFARTGFQFDPPGRADVLFEQTTWFALIEIVIGLLLLGGASSVYDRSMGIFASLVAVALGIILAAAPEAADGRLVAGDGGAGLFLAFIGAVCALTAWFAPVRRVSDRVAVADAAVEESVVVDDRVVDDRVVVDDRPVVRERFRRRRY